jgi:uncharacterized delta-60 repeat protein
MHGSSLRSAALVLVPALVLTGLGACGGDDDGGGGTSSSSGGSSSGGTSDAGAGDVAVSDGGPDGPTGPVVPGADPGFGAGGLATLNSASSLQAWTAVVRQADGDLVVAGSTQEEVVVARVKPNGTFDATFGAGGFVRMPWGAPNGGPQPNAASVALQADGKILVAASLVDYASKPQAIVARLEKNGTFDATFGSAGRVLVAPQRTTHAFSIALQSSGKIVLGGATLLERLLANGAPDPSFNGTGVVQPGGMGAATALAILGDDRILVGDTSPRVWRFSADGALDTVGFASPNGYVVVPSTGSYNGVRSIAAQPDGAIVFGGDIAESGGGSTPRFTVGRITTSGVLDATFNGTGIVRDASSNAALSTGAYAVGIAGDGSIVTSGIAGAGGTKYASTARLTSTGAFDPTFGDQGYGPPLGGTRNIGLPSLAAFGGVLEPSGAMVSVGQIQNAGSFDLGIGRTRAAGVADPAFGTNGVVSRAVGGAFDRAQALVLQSDGKVIVGNDHAQVIRLDASGAEDPSFGSGGVASTAFGFAAISSLAVQASGKILVGGSKNLSPSGFAIGRLDPSGAPDPGFGSGGKAGGAIVAGQSAASTCFTVAPSGAIVVAGQTLTPAAKLEAAVMRLSADGMPDATFGTGGASASAFGDFGGVLEMTHVAVQSDARVLVLGYAGSPSSAFVARFDAQGGIDTTFGSSGRAAVGPGVSYALALDGAGRALVLSGTKTGSLELRRFTAGGQLDGAFATGGVASVEIGKTSYALGKVAAALVVQSDGKILVGAATSDDGLLERAALFRFGADGVLDASYGTTGKKTLAIGAGGSAVHALVIDAAGRLVVAGRVWTESGASDTAVLRLLAP